MSAQRVNVRPGFPRLQRINVRPGGTLEIVAHCGSWPRWQAACSAARGLGMLLKCVVIVRDADAEGRGWKDGRPR